MKLSSVFLCLMIFLFSFCFIEQASAMNKVYPLDSLYGIVADDMEWSCETSTKGNEAIGVRIGERYVKGKALYLPISFDFFYRSFNWGISADLHKPSSAVAFNYAKEFLSGNGYSSSTVFSGASIKTYGENESFIISGSYFDNVSSGRFAFCIKPSKNLCYYMFIKIPGDLLDDRSIEYLFQETFNLISPLVIE